MRFADTPGPELLAALTELTIQQRRIDAQRLDLIGEMDRLGVAHAAGYPNLPALLMDTLRVSRGTATRLVARAQQVGDVLTPTGHLTPAPLPTLRAALHDGAVDVEHLDVVAAVLAELPDTASAQDRETVESLLAALARETHPHAVRRLGNELLTRLDRDGRQPTDPDLAEPHNLLRYRRNRDGSMTFTGTVDPETGEVFEALLHAIGTPQPQDPRSQAERYGDATAEIFHLAGKATDVPQRGGRLPQVTVYLDHGTLCEDAGVATLEGGATLHPSAARRIACDAGIIPVVLNGTSGPLDVGREKRCITHDQRVALIARDKGCAFPHCDRAPRWCDGHHITHWAHGGSTNLNNLVMLCRRHHRLVHHSEWAVRITNGHPEFLPPTWLDHTRTPLRNTLRQ
ncbi:MAG: DUF222 domain-containing protein [Labedaea sp.]